MQQIKYRITSLSPLLFSSNSGDPNMVETLDYIPGTYIRGMLAQEFIKRKKLLDAHKDETFYNLFLRGDVVFTNAYICDNLGQNTYPVPLSFQKEKYPEHSSKCDNGIPIYDMLFIEDGIDKKTKSIEGYYFLDNNNLHTVRVKRRLNFHHARDRETGTSKEGFIFNYDSIEEGQVFEGYIIGKEDRLRQIIDTIENGIYYVGRSRSNQYGLIRFEIIEREPVDFVHGTASDVQNNGEIVLTLISDTIIYNGNGYSTTDTMDFEKELRRLTGTDVHIKKAFIKQVEEEGFISVWKLKTPSEVCFKAGSCFLLEKVDIGRLKEIQKTGIGIRTNEGFGRFVIGWQGKDKPFNMKEVTDEIKPTKPHGALPESVKKLVEDIIKGQIKKQIQIKAINDAGEFKNLPTKSLLAKLEGAVREGSLKTLLEGLKKTAKNKLEHCRNSEKDLYEFLKNFSINIENEIKNISEGLCDEISYKPEKELKAELEKTHLLTFLSTMRKKKKQLEREGK
jgi:CRISPR-associated protein Csx10